MTTTSTQAETVMELKQRSKGEAQDDDAAGLVAEQVFPDINTIRNAIPAHCFQPPVWRSLAYVVRDLSLILPLGYLALTYIPSVPNVWARAAAWIVYGYVQGLFCTGLWILAHECGHGAFSLNQRLNDTVGWAAHSFLFVPYFSWKFSHHRHHRFTGHMTKDMAFVPRTKDEHYATRASSFWLDPDMLEDLPAYQLFVLVLHQLGGWQAYLFFNASSGKESLQRKETSWFRVSHFEPTSAVFRPSERPFIALSVLGLSIVGYVLHLASAVYGWKTIFLLYWVPYLWVHHWLVAITYLHHTHPDVHHYDPDSWTFVKGALATVDRDFGFIDRRIFHGIIGTHVVHHLFPRIPFYYAEEATEAIKPVVGDHYCRQEGSFVGSLWSTFTTCKYVESDPDVPGAMRWGKGRR